MTIYEKIMSIDWENYQTAYGKASEDIPSYLPMGNGRDYIPKVAQSLEDLFSHDKKVALRASHDLWCCLCHQHSFVSSAALPAYDILFYGLQHLEDDLKVELLDIMMGFSLCLPKGTPIHTWQGQLRAKLERDKPYFQMLLSDSKEEIACFAETIVEAL